MTGLRALSRKELLEQWRTWRLPIVIIVFALGGITSPLLARYSPEILEAVAGDQIPIAIPDPTIADSVMQILRNLSQFGALAAILLAMGSVATEVERGTAALILTKPVTRSAFLSAKLLGIGAVLAISTVVGVALGAIYTVLLFETPSWSGFAAMAGLLWLQLSAFGAITFLGSALTGSALAAGAIGLVASVVLAILSAFPRIGELTPSGLSVPATALALGLPVDTATLWTPVLATVALIVICLGLAWWGFRRREL